MKKSALIITFNIVVILLLLIAQIAASNRLATGGVMLGKTEGEIHSYQTENAILREKIALSSSLTQIAAKAGKLGFAENKITFVLTKSQPLAAKP